MCGFILWEEGKMTHYTHMLQDENGVVWFYQPTEYYRVIVNANNEEASGIMCKKHKDRLVAHIHKTYSPEHMLFKNIHISVEPMHKICVCVFCEKFDSLKDEEVRK